MAKKKFYAYRNSKEACIVDNWEECKALSVGQPQGKNQSFKSLEEAEAYIKANWKDVQFVPYNSKTGEESTEANAVIVMPIIVTLELRPQ